MISLVLLALTDAAEDRPTARLASALAARYGAELDVLAVVGDGRSPARREDEVRGLLTELLPQGVAPHVRALRGDPRDEFSRALGETSPDVLVIGGPAEADGASRAKDMTAGPNEANRLVAANPPCALLVASRSSVDDRPCGPFERILCAVDLGDEPEDDPASASATLDFSARFTAREGAELTVLHVARPEEDARRTAGVVAERLNVLCQGLPGAGRFALVAAHGDPADGILANAETSKADLIVLAPGAHPHADGVCARVLLGARPPVLLIGPAALASAGLGLL